MSDTALPVHHGSQVHFAIPTTQRHEQSLLLLCIDSCRYGVQSYCRDLGALRCRFTADLPPEPVPLEDGGLPWLRLTQRQAMSDDEAEPFILVTQWFCAGVATYVVFVWSLKINMLFFFRRVVKGA